MVVRWPVLAGLFHPFSGRDGILAASPLSRLPNAICNYSQGSIQILTKNMFATLIRQYGRNALAGDYAHATNTGHNHIVVNFTPNQKPTLRLSFE